MYEITSADRSSTEEVAAWIAGVDPATVPEHAKATARLVLLDTLGVMIGSTVNDLGRAILGGGCSISTGGAVIVPGTGAGTDAASAAMVYGTLGHGIELDEVHLPSRQHAGATAAGAVLALGQHLDSSISAVLDALLVGYEIAGHLGIAVDNNILLDRNFHMSGVVSVFGCTAASAHLLRLDAGRVYSALGLAASQASGTLAWHTESHHMSKSLQCGLAARNGVTAALLARADFLGPDSVFAGPCNFFRAFRGADPATDWHHRLGREFEILNSSMKLYAAGRPMHAALDALFDMMKRDGTRADDIAAMAVHLPPGAARIVDGNYTNSIDCRTVMATAAIDGKFGLEQADDARMTMSDVQALKQRIRVVHDDALNPYFPRSFPATVEISYKDGRASKLTVIAATGERERPMTVDALREKFIGLVDAIIGRRAADEVIALVTSPGNARMRDLARLFVAQK